MKRPIVPNPRLPEWRTRLVTRQVDEFLDSQFERRREFNRRKMLVLRRKVKVP